MAIRTDGGLVSHPTDIARTMMNGLLPDNTEDGTEELRYVREKSGLSVIDWNNEVVTMKELRTAVSKQKNGRAPGHDGIRADILKRAFSQLDTSLLCVVREVFSTGTFPRA